MLSILLFALQAWKISTVMAQQPLACMWSWMMRWPIPMQSLRQRDRKLQQLASFAVPSLRLVAQSCDWNTRGPNKKSFASCRLWNVASSFLNLRGNWRAVVQVESTKPSKWALVSKRTGTCLGDRCALCVRFTGCAFALLDWPAIINMYRSNPRFQIAAGQSLFHLQRRA